MVVPVNPVGIVPGTMKPLEPQAFYVTTYQLGVSSFLKPGPSEWPLTPAPSPLTPSWTWRQVHMLGQDRVPGKQSYDLPPKPPQRLPYYGTEWRQVGMLGQDQLPVGEQVYDLTPKSPQRSPYYGTEWRQVGMLGQDVVPGEQFYDRPPLAAPRLPLYTWEWRQVDKLGLDQLPIGEQRTDLTVREPYGKGQTWVLNLQTTTLAPVVVTGPLGVVANQYDWPLPPRVVWYRDWGLNLLTTTLAPTVQNPFYQLDWPLPRAPGRIDETWTWNQLPMLGMDQLPVGEQTTDLTPKAPPRLAYYGTEWNQLRMLGQDKLPVGKQVHDLTVHRFVPFRPEQTWTWRQVGMLGQDILLVGDQIYDLPPKPAQRLPYYGTEWRQVQMLGQDRLPKNQYDWPLPNRGPYRIEQTTTWRQVGMLGQDQLPTGDQVYDRPPLAAQRVQEIYNWIQSVNLALVTTPPVIGPLGVVANQYDWPLPRTPQQPAPSWTWRQVDKLGLDRLPKNQYDWPLPNRGPFQPNRSSFFRSQFIPIPPTPPVPASYFLLQPHYIQDRYIPAWTIVTEGIEIPFNWIPTLMVDPLNARAVTAFYDAGPRTGYQGPGYDWQGPQFLNSQRQASIQSPATHWRQVPGTDTFQLTGLGSSLPPVSG